MAARAAGIEGSGVVQVTYDVQGKPTRVEMARTTGSLILDKSTTLFVQQHWKSSGGQRTTKATAVDYQVAFKQIPEKPTPPTEHPRDLESIVAPHPPYPDIALQARVLGNVVVRVTYGARGGRVRTEILKSSGSDILDGYSADYIRLYWKYYGDKTTVHTTVLAYKIR